MGWFWNSSPPNPEGSSDIPTPTSTTAAPPPATTSSTQTPPAQPGSASTDREMAMFMQMLMKDTQSSDSSTAATTTPTQPPPPAESKSTTTTTSSSWLPWSSSSTPSTTTEPTHQQPPQPTQQHPRQTRSSHSLAMSEHLLPTTMSCRDAFDYAWHCHTPGSQWNAVYRYGSVRTCSELWDDFWFCMRTKSYSPEMKAEAIKEHYRAKEEAKYGGGKPSSEDVWESREERVKPGTVFQEKFEPPVVDDEEFQRMDAERRRRIREVVDGREGSKDNKE